MALVVFVRGVNVGGHKAFRPSVFARELADLDVASVGAAGTFVIRKRVGVATVQAEFRRRMPFEAELMICQAREILDLAAAAPFGDKLAKDNVTRYVSVLAKRPRTIPPLPIERPAGRDWQVKVFAVEGRFALSLHRRLGRTLVYPNEVVEKSLGVRATTRNWNTIAAVCALLNVGKA
jgi:uncharacterized protein (DUF1697 family)